MEDKDISKNSRSFIRKLEVNGVDGSKELWRNTASWIYEEFYVSFKWVDFENFYVDFDNLLRFWEFYGVF